MNVLALQFDVAWENKPANYHKVRQLLTEAVPEKASLVLLPEMFATGFSMNTEAVTEPYGGQTEQFLAGLACEFGVAIVAGVAARAGDGRARNKALVFSPEAALLGFYAKMRPFSPGGELEHYVPGDRPLVVSWNDCTFSPFVCYDLRFPELFRQVAAKQRPELFVVIANWPAKRVEHWVRLLQARAIENQAYVVGVNRVGRDPFLRLLRPFACRRFQWRHRGGWGSRRRRCQSSAGPQLIRALSAGVAVPCRYSGM